MIGAVDLRPLVVIIPPVVTSLIAYLLTVRKLSGRIANTDSDKLWAEAADMRADYRRLNRELTERVLTLVRQNSEQQIQMGALREEFEACQRRLHILEKNGGLK